VRVWRIARRPYADLSGKGGMFGSGRWHNQGVKLIYTAASAALASIEYVVNTTQRPLDTVLMEITIPEEKLITIEEVIGGPLPGNRDGDHQNTRPLGMAWLESGRCAMLSVPSIVIPTERNILLNPDHPDFYKVTLIDVKPFFFDPRIYKQ